MHTDTTHLKLLGCSPVHRQSPQQGLNLRMVQLARTGNRQVDDLFGQVVRDERISVPVSPHPRAQSDEPAIDR